MHKFDYLVIGNSAAAVGCIEGLRSVDRYGSMGVVSEEHHHVYSRALIPYFLEGKIDREKMHYRPRDFYSRAGVALFAGEKAEHMDTERKEVQLAGGDRLQYDKLLLATGGKPVIPPVNGLGKDNVFTFLSLDDVFKIKEALPGARNAVVLGGGVIGLMAAEALHKKGLQVHVLELAERVLAPVVDEPASRMVEQTFRESGVQVYTSNTIKETRGNEKVDTVILQDGTNIPCDILIVGVGVAPRTELAGGAGIRVDRGIVVDKKMQTSAPAIYAAGDCASIYDFVLGENRPLPLWPNAYAGGRVAAYNMAGKDREYTGGTAMNSMHFFGVNIINAGLNLSSGGEAKEIIEKRDEERKIYRKFIINENGVLEGLILMGEIERAGIFLNLMRKKIDVRPFRQQLLQKDFGYAAMPQDTRWSILKDDVILGVV